MPTFEIVSFRNCKGLKLNQDDFLFAIIKEVQSSIITHRSLFSKFLKTKSGTIIHLGNPDFIKEDYGFFAGKLLDFNFISEKEPDPEGSRKIRIPCDGESGTNQNFFFRFDSKYLERIKEIVELAYIKSPEKQAYFLSDYQFGPSKKKIINLKTPDDLWRIYETEGFRFNTLYFIN